MGARTERGARVDVCLQRGDRGAIPFSYRKYLRPVAVARRHGFAQRLQSADADQGNAGPMRVVPRNGSELRERRHERSPPVGAQCSTKRFAKRFKKMKEHSRTNHASENARKLLIYREI